MPKRVRDCRPPLIQLVNILVSNHQRSRRIQIRHRPMPPRQLRPVVTRVPDQVPCNVPAIRRIQTKRLVFLGHFPLFEQHLSSGRSGRTLARPAIASSPRSAPCVSLLAVRIAPGRSASTVGEQIRRVDAIHSQTDPASPQSEPQKPPAPIKTHPPESSSSSGIGNSRSIALRRNARNDVGNKTYLSKSSSVRRQESRHQRQLGHPETFPSTQSSSAIRVIHHPGVRIPSQTPPQSATASPAANSHRHPEARHIFQPRIAVQN